jgi:hypothetical protein
VNYILEETKMNTNTNNNKPAPRVRRRAAVYQYYRVWNELIDVRKQHMSRLRFIESGISTLDPEIEILILKETRVDELIDKFRGLMIESSKALTPDFHAWITTIKGVGDKTAAALIGEIDDIGRFDTISKLWRFSGFAVFDGHREHHIKGKPSSFNQRLKSLVFLIGVQFVRQQTPLYSDIYYAEKKRLREVHPEKIKVDGKWKYNDGHLHNMAIGKMVKIFLAHVWLVWRYSEGLPTSEPYSSVILGHTNIIEPPQFDMDDYDNRDSEDAIDLLEEENNEDE